MNAALQILPETLRWRSREVRYYEGGWDDVLSVLPDFETVPFRAGPEEPSNPFLLTVVRKPLTAVERPMPVGVVSHRYSLIQHRDVAMRCREGLVHAGVDPDDLRYEVGVSQLGEWMNFRIYLPDNYSLRDSQEEVIDLRLECFNAVDGTSRLIVLFGWYRLVCANGMVIGESRIEIRERHGQPLEMDSIPKRIASSLDAAQADRQRLEEWERELIDIKDLAPWVDGSVTEFWGKKAAARVFHICRTGRDVEIETFARGAASEKPVRWRRPVAGSPSQAGTKYDVAQALSFVATRRNDADERLGRQADIPVLLQQLPSQPVRRRP
ncbi:MAG: DUF932 domain-containing protein [Bryobacterales bacterium]|nr:DUF932 domain-containing protein [Bryobacterales bacterium]